MSTPTTTATAGTAQSLTASRNFMLELTEDQRECEATRAVFGCWNDVIHVLCDSAYQLRAAGETRQAEAMLIDAESMARRARTHLFNVSNRHRLQVQQQVEHATDALSASSQPGGE